jgi:tetratricopeptide (TPR) repeat protein
MRKGIAAATFIACALVLTSGAYCDAVQDLIAGITDASPEVRTAAWKGAGPAGAAAVPALAGPMASDDPEVARCAIAALDRIAYHAGRPGAGEERAAVAAELSKLLANSYPVDARREVAYLVSLVGGADEVPALATLLQNPELADDARMALERIPGPAAGKALTAALDTAPPELQIRLIQALAHRAEQGATNKLTALARESEHDEVRWASYEALTGFGLLPMEVMPADPGFSPAERARFIQGFMRAAQALEDKGESEKAERAYASVAVFPATPEQASTALLGLARLKSDMLLEHALGYLVEPGIHTTASQTLKETDLPETDALLLKAYPRTEPIKRAALLPILAARNTPDGMALVRDARTDENAEVRMTAYTLVGEDVPVGDLQQVMTRGSMWGRGTAAKAYVGAAWSLQKAGQGEQARAMFELAAKARVGAQYKLEALRGVETVASAESLPFVTELEPVMKSKTDPELALAAARAWVAVHAALPDKQQAIAALFKVIEGKDTPAPLASFATEKLSTLGVDTEAIPQRQGFITNWQILGPFPNPGGEAFGKSFFNEADAAVPEAVDQKTWKPATTDGLPAIIDLAAQFDRNVDVAAYAKATVTVPRPTKAVFLIGSDDGCEFWVNGDKLHAAGAPRGLQVDQDRVAADLKAGANTVLIKVLQGAVDWKFCVRVALPDGTPVDLSAQ